jgi:hypothetical protein
MTSRDMLRFAIALLLGAAIAFPAGMMVARRTEPTTMSVRPGPAAMREVFSPTIRDDPYFLDQQRQAIEALEAHCRRTGEMCAEARAAQRRFDEQAK